MKGNGIPDHHACLCDRLAGDSQVGTHPFPGRPQTCFRWSSELNSKWNSLLKTILFQLVAFLVECALNHCKRACRYAEVNGSQCKGRREHSFFL